MAVCSLVGNLARPPIQMRLERRPALEPPAGVRVLLDVADSAFVFPLCFVWGSFVAPLNRANSLLRLGSRDAELQAEQPRVWSEPPGAAMKR